jgi:integrase
MKTKKRKLTEGLTAVQLNHWIQSVRTGTAPTIKNRESQEITTLRMPLVVADGGGLTFTLSYAGTATWVLRYRYGGRQRELTIGNYPDIGLSEAREIARKKRAEIDSGGDPAADKRRAAMTAATDWTVRALIKDYRDKILAGLGKSTQRSYGRNLERIETRIGSLLVTKITPVEIVWLIDDVGAPWVESNMLLVTAKMLFRHAVGKRLIVTNPCVGVELTALKGKRPPVKRRLMLSDEELHVLLNANMSRENLLAVKILLGTAVRTDELRNAQWEHVDIDAGIWSIPASKMGREIQIPLSKEVKTWFKELKLFARESKFVLPARSGDNYDPKGSRAPINPNTLGSAIEFWLQEHKPTIRRFTPHDLRSTAKSHMRALGIPREITEMCLNHKVPGVEGIYDAHTYFDERSEALSLWGAKLARLEKQPPGRKSNLRLVA